MSGMEFACLVVIRAGYHGAAFSDMYCYCLLPASAAIAPFRKTRPRPLLRIYCLFAHTVPLILLYFRTDMPLTYSLKKNVFSMSGNTTGALAVTLGSGAYFAGKHLLASRKTACRRGYILWNGAIAPLAGKSAKQYTTMSMRRGNRRKQQRGTPSPCQTFSEVHKIYPRLQYALTLYCPAKYAPVPRDRPI